MSTETKIKKYLQDESLQILKVNNLRLLQEAPEKVTDLLKKCEFISPSVNIEEAEKVRKALKQGRIDIEKIVKDVTSSLNNAKTVIIDFEKDLLKEVIEAEERQGVANQLYLEEQAWEKAVETNTKEAFESYIAKYSKKNSIALHKQEAEKHIAAFEATEKAVENKYNAWVDETTQTIYAINTSNEASALIAILENLDVEAFAKFAEAAQEKRDSFLAVIDTKLANLISAEFLLRLNEVKAGFTTDIMRSTLDNIGNVVQSIKTSLAEKPNFGEHSGLAIQELSKLFSQAQERQAFLVSQKEMAEAKAEMERQQAEMKAMQEEIAKQKAELERAENERKAEILRIENERKAAEAKAEAEKQAEIERLAKEKAAEIERLAKEKEAQAKEVERLAIDKEATDVNAKISITTKAFRNAESISDIENVRELIVGLENINPVYDFIKKSLAKDINQLLDFCNEKALQFQIAEETAELERQGKVKIDGTVYEKSILVELKAYFNSESFQDIDQKHSSESIDSLIEEMVEGKAAGKQNWKDLTTIQKQNEAYRNEILNKVNDFASELFADGKLRNAFANGILNAHDLAKQFNTVLVFNSTK